MLDYQDSFHKAGKTHPHVQVAMNSRKCSFHMTCIHVLPKIVCVINPPHTTAVKIMAFSVGRTAKKGKPEIKFGQAAR